MPDSVPSVAERGRAAERGIALAAEQDRRVRLLHRLRLEAQRPERERLALELGLRLCPEHLESARALARDCSAPGEVDPDCLEFLLEPACADAEHQASARQYVQADRQARGRERMAER